MKIMVDCSLSLINRTGAHYIAQELIASLGAHFSCIRQWRLMNRRIANDFARKLIGRLMLRELTSLRDSAVLPWPDPDFPEFLRLFLDPLYVLRSNLSSADIVLCHDVGPLTHPLLFSESVTDLYETAYAKVAKAKPGIVFVSNTTRDAFVALFGRDFRFLRTIPLYVRSAAATGDDRPPVGVATPYILTVGALERRKNQLTAMRAYREAGLVHEGIGYVLCGPRGDGAADIIAEAARTPGVKVLGYVEDTELRWLYRNASAFVLPSLLEGFGMPVLEVAQYGRRFGHFARQRARRSSGRARHSGGPARRNRHRAGTAGGMRHAGSGATPARGGAATARAKLLGSTLSRRVEEPPLERNSAGAVRSARAVRTACAPKRSVSA